MQYILYPDTQSLLPQVLVTEQLLDKLQKREIGPDALLFVSETQTYLPALEYAVLIARERGIAPGELPSLPADRFTGGNSSDGTASKNAQAATSETAAWDADTDDISALPLMGAPIRLEGQEDKEDEPAYETPVGLAASPDDHRAQRDPHELLYEHVRRLATISLERFYGNNDRQVEALLHRYRRALRRQALGWLLVPLFGAGAVLLLRSRSDKRRIQERLEQVGITSLAWDQTLRDDRETQQLLRRIPRCRALAFSVLAILVIVLLLATSVVHKVLYFFQTDKVSVILPFGL